MARAECRWYVYPQDVGTNGVIAGLLPTMTTDEVLTVDGKLPLWKIDRQNLSALKKSKVNLNLKFIVYVKKGGGMIRRSFIDGRRRCQSRFRR